MPCGWEGNHRFGIALTLHHRLQWINHLQVHRLRTGDEHPAYTLYGVGHPTCVCWEHCGLHLLPRGLWQHTVYSKWLARGQHKTGDGVSDILRYVGCSNWQCLLALRRPAMAEVRWRTPVAAPASTWVMPTCLRRPLPDRSCSSPGAPTTAWVVAAALVAPGPENFSFLVFCKRTQCRGFAI